MKIKNIFLLTGFLLIAIFLNCSQEDPAGPTVFFNVTQISATRSGSTITFSSYPDEVTMLVVGVFNGTQINVDSNNIITNTDWVGGNRTGLTDMDSTDCTSYWTYNTVTKDFNDGIAATINTGDVWAVWGYNADGIVICSTEKYIW